MRSATTITGLLVTLLLAGASAAALAQAHGEGAPALDDAEIGRIMEDGRLFDLDSAWPVPEPLSRFTLGGSVSMPVRGAPATAQGDQTQSAIARGLKARLPVDIDPAALPAELNRNLAITEMFKGGIKAGFDAPVGDEMRLTAASVQTQLALGGVGRSMSWGWYTGVDMNMQGDISNAIAAGPQFKLGDDRLAFTLNPKLAHGIGAHGGGDVAFAYSAGLKGELTKGVALGIEAFGTTSDVAPVPGMALHTPRGSQALYVGLGLAPQPMGDASKFSLEVGAPGMTEAAPDPSGRIKAAVTW